MSVLGCIFEHMFDEGAFPPDFCLPDDTAFLAAADLYDPYLNDPYLDDPYLDDPHLHDPHLTDPHADSHRVSPDSLLQRLAQQLPSASLVAMLATIDPTALDPDEGITYLQVLERVIAWCHYLQSEALVAVAGPHSRVDRYLAGAADASSRDSAGTGDSGTFRAAADIEDGIRDEVSAALNWTAAFAQRRINVARHLAGPLLETSRALSRGLVGYPQAAMMSEAAERLPAAGAGSAQDQQRFAIACRLLQERVLPVAQRSTLGRARQAAERALLAIDAEHARARRRASSRGHDVFVVGETDGNSLLIARMKAEQAHACLTAVESLAKNAQLAVPSHASAGQRRAAALATLLIGGPLSPPPSPGTASPTAPPTIPATSTTDTAPPAPSTDTAPPTTSTDTAPPTTSTDTAPPAIAAQPVVHLDIIIGLESLLGLTCEPGQVRGAGPIPADVVRELLNDATMRRLVSDPLTGHLLDYGRKTYRVSDRLREFIQARDGTCRFPGCSRRAERCQIDHAEPWRSGGATTPANLGALCTRHHQLKTHGGWRIVSSDESGACSWVSPLGRRYDRHAAPLLGESTHAAPLLGGDAPATRQPADSVPDNEAEPASGTPTVRIGADVKLGHSSLPRPDPPPF